MLNADATGPSVPAIMGKADDANHHRLGTSHDQTHASVRLASETSLPRLQMGGVILEAIPSWQMILRDVCMVPDVVAKVRVVHRELLSIRVKKRLLL
jgi:hypothetical protein